MSAFMRFDMTPDPRHPPSGKLLLNANVPRRYWTASLAQVPDDGACEGYKKAIADYIANMHETVKKGRSLLLVGPKGTGKTALACVVLREAMARGPNHAWFEVAKDIDFHAMHRAEANEEGHAVWDMLNKSLYAVIDDLGTERSEKASPHDTNWIERVLRERYNQLRPTIVTTNLDPGTKLKVADGLVEIIEEAYRVVEVDGFKWRERA